MQLIYSIFSLFLRLSILWLLSLSLLHAAEQPGQWTKGNMNDLLILYKEFHSRPELSFQEQITAARLANAWMNCGFEVSISVENFPPVSVQKFPHGLAG